MQRRLDLKPWSKEQANVSLACQEQVFFFFSWGICFGYKNSWLVQTCTCKKSGKVEIILAFGGLGIAVNFTKAPSVIVWNNSFM